MTFATVYCLDLSRAVRATQLLDGDAQQLRRIAERYLQDFPAVEVWQGRRCQLRLEQERPRGH